MAGKKGFWSFLRRRRSRSRTRSPTRRRAATPSPDARSSTSSGKSSHADGRQSQEAQRPQRPCPNPRGQRETMAWLESEDTDQSLEAVLRVRDTILETNRIQRTLGHTDPTAPSPMPSSSTRHPAGPESRDNGIFLTPSLGLRRDERRVTPEMVTRPNQVWLRDPPPPQDSRQRRRRRSGRSTPLDTDAQATNQHQPCPENPRPASRTASGRYTSRLSNITETSQDLGGGFNSDEDEPSGYSPPCTPRPCGGKTVRFFDEPILIDPQMQHADSSDAETATQGDDGDSPLDDWLAAIDKLSKDTWEPTDSPDHSPELPTKTLFSNAPEQLGTAETEEHKLVASQAAHPVPPVGKETPVSPSLSLLSNNVQKPLEDAQAGVDEEPAVSSAPPLPLEPAREPVQDAQDTGLAPTTEDGEPSSPTSPPSQEDAQTHLETARSVPLRPAGKLQVVKSKKPKGAAKKAKPATKLTRLPSEFTPLAHSPLTEEGQHRLQAIKTLLGMDESVTARDVQSYLCRNQSLIRHIFRMTVPHPGWIYYTERSGEHDEMTVTSPRSIEMYGVARQAIAEVAWEDEEVRYVIEMAFSSQKRHLWNMDNALYRTTRDEITRPLHTRLMAEHGLYRQVRMGRAAEEMKMRLMRPMSLLSRVVQLEDVVEEAVE